MKLYIEEMETPGLEDEDYRYLEMRSEGRKYFNIYRGIKNNRGVWAAVEVDGKTMKEIGEPFEITYDQGRGLEPIDPDNNKLQKMVGKALGLRRESITESPVATVYTDVDTYIIPDVYEQDANEIINFAARTNGVEDCFWTSVNDDFGQVEVTADTFIFRMILLWAYRKGLVSTEKRISDIMHDNNIYESKRTRKRSNLTEKSNFDDVEKAIRYYYPKWYYDDMSVNDIFDSLEKLGHSQDFIDAVIAGITEKYEDEEDYELDESVEIEVKNKGILEVPEGKNVDDLPMSHFEKLVKKNGLSKITKALNNLQVWNKNDDKKLSKWAGDMIDKLTKKYGKNESISVKRFNEGWHNGDAIITFTHNDDLEADLEEFLFYIFKDNPDVFDFDWSGRNTNLYLACNKDDYDYIKWFIEDWKDKHKDEYDESLKEDTYKSYWKYDVESPVLNRNEDSDTYLTKYDIKKVKLIPCKTPEECYEDERYWAVCNYDYPHDEFYGTKQEAYDMLLASWNNSTYERIHDI